MLKKSEIWVFGKLSGLRTIAENHFLKIFQPMTSCVWYKLSEREVFKIASIFNMLFDIFFVDSYYIQSNLNGGIMVEKFKMASYIKILNFKLEPLKFIQKE
jgi:hypothetical protein